MVCRIQNLHISQTNHLTIKNGTQFVEFKIYISLKHINPHLLQSLQFVEFKIYISLKLSPKRFNSLSSLQNSKFTYLSNENYGYDFFEMFVEFKIYISLKQVSYSTNTARFVEFKIYISLKQRVMFVPIIFSLQNSKFTYLSNRKRIKELNLKVCRIQNLHISQTSEC